MYFGILSIDLIIDAKKYKNSNYSTWIFSGCLILLWRIRFEGFLGYIFPPPDSTKLIINNHKKLTNLLIRNLRPFIFIFFLRTEFQSILSSIYFLWFPNRVSKYRFIFFVFINWTYLVVKILLYCFKLLG